MTRGLTLEEVLELHRLILKQSGGGEGVRDWSGLEAAIASPWLTFDGQDLYSNLIEKAAMLGFALVCNHPFVDGNKRIGHAAMEAFLILNGWEFMADVDEQEQLILRLAAGGFERDEFTDWVRANVQQRFTVPKNS